MAGALGAFQGQYATNIPLLTAGSLLILTPTLIVFLIFQRQFVSALLQGSLKG
jgi:raffinose/stachyose/melibiose transport system permease protein